MRRPVLIAVLLTAVAIPTNLNAQQRETSISAWITTDDFPPNWAEAKNDGGVTVHFTVTPDGRASNCTVQYANGLKRLGARVCELVEERARYIPAYTVGGSPTGGEDQLEVSWKAGKLIVGDTDFGGAIPSTEPRTWMADAPLPTALFRPGPANLDMSLVIQIRSDGRIGDCHVTAPEPSDASEKSDANGICKSLKRHARFHPPIGRDGRPLEASGKIALHWKRL